MTARNPYVFIVGAARSGTTLLQRMLDAHPMIAVVNETYWLPRKPKERDGLTPDGLVTPALIAKLLEAPKFARMELDRDFLSSLVARSGPISYPAFVSTLFDRFANDRGKPLGGDKTPGYVRKMDALHRLWPQARFVHLIRDGRDVCSSFLDWTKGEQTAGQYGTWAEDPVTSAALYWRRSVLMGRQSGAALGSHHYQEIRYESLIAHPLETCANLCQFLDLAFDPSMLHFHRGRTRLDGDRSSKARWLPPTRGLRDWRSDLSPDEIGRFEVACGDLLDELGYERGPASPSREARSRVERVKERFTENAEAAGRALPAGW